MLTIRKLFLWVLGIALVVSVVFLETHRFGFVGSEALVPSAVFLVLLSMVGFCIFFFDGSWDLSVVAIIVVFFGFLWTSGTFYYSYFPWGVVTGVVSLVILFFFSGLIARGYEISRKSVFLIFLLGTLIVSVPMIITK